MRRTLITLAAIIAASVPAVASGGLGCDADDLSLKFNVETAVSRGMGGAFFNLRASLDVAMDGIPDDLRKLTLDDALVHSWLDGEELKLQFYLEREEGDFASVDFVVETVRVDEGEYRGDYVMTVLAAQADSDTGLGTWAARGHVVCYVE